MNVFKKAYYRSFQFVLKLATPFLPYKEPKILSSTNQIIEVLKSKKIKSVLLVTGPNLRAKKITEPLELLLKENQINLSVYDKTEPNPTITNIEEARGLYLKNNCQAIIGFGGGSNLDCAKGVGARIACPKKSIGKLKGLMKIRKKIPLLIAVPTTAGSGSETTLSAVITDKQKQEKYAINSFALIPSYALLDSTLTKTLPKRLVATTGMDALTHAIEAYVGRATTKKTREWAEEAIKLIYENIFLAYSDNTNDLARQNLLKASYLAGLAFSRSYVGYVHALSHALSAKYNLEHGKTNAIILPYVLKEYGKTIKNPLYRLALLLNLDKNDSLDLADKFILEIEKLNEKMEIYNKIEIDREDLSFLASHAEKEANLLYPVPKLFTKKELEEVYIKMSL